MASRNMTKNCRVSNADRISIKSSNDRCMYCTISSSTLPPRKRSPCFDLGVGSTGMIVGATVGVLDGAGVGLKVGGEVGSTGIGVGSSVVVLDGDDVGRTGITKIDVGTGAGVGAV
jgi:hypothetical protein